MTVIVCEEKTNNEQDFGKKFILVLDSGILIFTNKKIIAEGENILLSKKKNPVAVFYEILVYKLSNTEVFINNSKKENFSVIDYKKCLPLVFSENLEEINTIFEKIKQGIKKGDCLIEI